MMESLYSKLISYSDSDYYGFHMPGHKRNRAVCPENLPFQIDITEIDGFDDLHHASGILKEAQERAARVYQAEETHFLINGSTCGILSAVMGCTQKGDKILVARNCHKSVYHAMYMKELEPLYLYPKYDTERELNGGLSPADVRQALKEHSEIKAVIIVSPTYDGAVSDVKAIAEAAHQQGVPLIVDEAHGAHFGFHPYFPENANTKRADLVIHSLHKTLPSLTQTALLHVNGTLVDRRQVKRYLDMLQTSSPSYVLMASMDSCIELLEDTKRRDPLFQTYAEELQWVRHQLREMKCLTLLETEHFDPSKIVISVKNARTTGYTSKQLYEELLDTYHLQMEMAAGSYVLAMTSVGDTRKGMERLVGALKEIDKGLLHQIDKKLLYPRGQENQENSASEERQRKDHSGRWYTESIGYISREFAYLYPPGIPILVPGEMVTEEAVERLNDYRAQGLEIAGLEDPDKIEVLKHG